MAEKPVYIGTSSSYENAANKTDIPRYSDEEKDEYARFAEAPEPELVYGKDEDEESKPEPEEKESGEKPDVKIPNVPTR